jgi:predicted O-methyltransferase YrrM
VFVQSLSDKLTKGLLYTRRRVLRAAARRGTAARLDELSRFDHPLAAKFARALQRMRRGDYSDATRWVSRIESERQKLASSREPLARFGDAAGPYDAGLLVRDACSASRSTHDALALYALVREFGPSRIVELGTNVGISSAYMAAALEESGAGSLITLEASPARSAIARRLHDAVGLRRVEYSVGLFEGTLEAALGTPVDFAFIDGHHQLEPTLDYFDRIWRRSTEGAVFIFDDIRWSTGMERAWRILQGDPRLRMVADLGGLGIGVGTLAPSATRRFVTRVLAV